MTATMTFQNIDLSSWDTLYTILSYLPEFLLGSEIFHTKVWHKTHTFYVRQLFFLKIVPFLRECVKNMVEADKPQTIIPRMRIACWIADATDTLRICNTYCFPTKTVVTRTLANVTSRVACLVPCHTLAQLWGWLSAGKMQLPSVHDQ
jgi:hypothetical protein